MIVAKTGERRSILLGMIVAKVDERQSFLHGMIAATAEALAWLFWYERALCDKTGSGPESSPL